MIELLTRARAGGHPLVDGETVTFLWRGANPPQLIGDFNDWGRADRPLKLRAIGTGVWARKLTFPRDAYVEYAFIRDKRRLRDPLNPRRVWNGIDHYNHFFYMPHAAPTPLARRSRAVPRGTLTWHVVTAPWLGESTLLFVAAQVLPLARAHLNLLDPAKHPGAYGVLGASMGGLMALYTGLRLPRIFGHVLSQQGAFALEDPGSVIWDLVRDGNPRPIKTWMEAGRYDIAPLIPGNRRMHELLVARGYDVAYREYDAGHNYSPPRPDD